MLNPDLKLEWGVHPKLIFNDYDELFEALGEISNPEYCAITYEANSVTGSYSDVFRVRFRIPTELLIAPIQRKITSQSRFNCNEFIQYFVDNNIFSFDANTKKVERNYQTVVDWVKNQDTKYVESFFRGYLETKNNPLPKEAKINPKDLLIINDDYVEQLQPRTFVKRELPASTPKSTGAGSKRVRKVDYVRKSIRDTELGLIGEFYVYQSEYNKLKAAEKNGQIESVEEVLSWVSKIDDSAGFDIQSYDPDTGKVIYIEVKSTSSSANTPFYISENELDFSKSHSNNYKLYRLYNLSKDSTDNIEYFEIEGDLRENDSLLIIPKTYEVRIK